MWKVFPFTVLAPDCSLHTHAWHAAWASCAATKRGNGSSLSIYVCVRVCLCVSKLCAASFSSSDRVSCLDHCCLEHCCIDHCWQTAGSCVHEASRCCYWRRSLFCLDGCSLHRMTMLCYVYSQGSLSCCCVNFFDQNVCVCVCVQRRSKEMV